MPELDNLQRRVELIFADRLNLAVPGTEEDLFAAGVLDSLSFVELLAELERQWEIKIELANLDLMHFSSVARIADYLRLRLRGEDAEAGEDARQRDYA